MNVHEPAAEVIELEAVEVIEVTELTPCDNTFIGKRIERDGRVTPYPKSVVWWRQAVARCPATIVALFDYLREARTRNIILIRGAPANLSRERTRRQNAGEKERGDHGFLDAPTRLFFFDIDGAPIDWRADPEGAVRRIVAQLGEPFASVSFVWFFSASHGLETETVEVGDEKHKRWTGRIGDGDVRVRLAFLTNRALDWREADALTRIAKARVDFKIDETISRRVQPNYIQRPYWDEHPGRDPLDGIPTIGWIRGACETVTVPADLAHKARWAKAQGHDAVIADHPDALSAVRGIGSDGAVRSHMMAAIRHLLKANPPPDHVSYTDHSLALADKLATMIAQLEEEIREQLAAKGRQWGEVTGYLPGNMSDWACWLMERPGALNRKTVKLAREERANASVEVSREAIFDRVARTIEQANDGVTLLIAPTGSRKSTLVRAAAVRYVTEHPEQSVVILVPRHRLGDEQVKALLKEHPDAAFTAAVWRGRHRDDPSQVDPKHPGKFMPMCWRSTEAKELEAALVDIESHLCKRGRGGRAVRCPHFEVCGYQRQKRTKANVWLAAHECMAHEMPAAFGKVGLVMVDESPLDAFMFGVDGGDEFTLQLDALRTPPAREFRERYRLMHGRAELYDALDQLPVPDDPHRGAPARAESLPTFVDRTVEGTFDPNSPEAEGMCLEERLAAIFSRGSFTIVGAFHARDMRALEWRGKVEPDIRPDMSAKEVREQLLFTADNIRIRKLVTLWGLLGAGGRVQVHRGREGRIIRMVGLRELAKGWEVPTLICDATGDAQLLRAIWPQLKCEVEDWQQLPRPDRVRIIQCVDRAVSKYAVAIEGEGEELARRQAAARRLYAAVLAKAIVDYEGQDIGVITYKSTKEWIQQNCFVPSWLKLFHHGDVTGTNALQNVRALFVIGRPLASAEAVTRMTEALFGDYIAERAYRVRPKRGRIPIPPDAAGNNLVLVDVWEHPDPRAERVRRQVTETALLQAVGRARAGLREADDPLDIHLWTDVPLSELGPVEPVLWSELEGGLDALMMATEGVWLENVTDAATAYKELFTANTLKQARKRGRTRARAEGGAPQGQGVDAGSPAFFSTQYVQSPFLWVQYQRPGSGKQLAHAVSLLGSNETKAWLEAKLGRLARFYATPWRQTASRKPGLQPDNDNSHRDDAFDDAAVGESVYVTLNKAARLGEASAAVQARPQEGARAGGRQGKGYRRPVP